MAQLPPFWKRNNFAHKHVLNLKYKCCTFCCSVICLLVVTRPMCLGTVERRLAAGWYWDANHCLRDIQQVNIAFWDRYWYWHWYWHWYWYWEANHCLSEIQQVKLYLFDWELVLALLLLLVLVLVPAGETFCLKTFQTTLVGYFLMNHDSLLGVDECKAVQPSQPPHSWVGSNLGDAGNVVIHPYWINLKFLTYSFHNLGNAKKKNLVHEMSLIILTFSGSNIISTAKRCS